MPSTRSTKNELVPFDPEMERTLCRLTREVRESVATMALQNAQTLRELTEPDFDKLPRVIVLPEIRCAQQFTHLPWESW